MEEFTKLWVQIPVLHKPGMVVPTYDPSLPAVEAGEPGVQGHRQLHREFETSLQYTHKTYLKQATSQQIAVAKQNPSQNLEENATLCPMQTTPKFTF